MEIWNTLTQMYLQLEIRENLLLQNIPVLQYSTLASG
jgi:hypothetical protein